MGRDDKPFATGQQVYNRIKWDPSIDESRFSVLWRQRSGELAEVPFLEWREDVIPWHRVEIFQRDGVIVWDRQRRVDEIVSPPDPMAALRAEEEDDEDEDYGTGALGAPGVHAMPTYRWEQSSWRVVREKELLEDHVRAPEQLRLATYNVLFDSFARHHIDESMRHATIFGELEELGADIIALQEVEPSFLSALARQPWVRRSYYLSDGPSAQSVTPHGQVILSRWPMRCALHKFSKQKRVVFANVEFEDRPLQVAAIHLTSSRAKNAKEKRAEQVERLLSLTRSAPEVIILGDFNLTHGEHSGSFEVEGFVDAWKLTHPDERGLTFNTDTNPTAALTASGDQRARFDRILCRLTQGSPVEVEHFAHQRRIGELAPSDHYGLVATLWMGQRRALDATPVVRSAVVVVPPERCHGPIQELRGQHDRRRLERWMPHITLLYPFTPERHFQEAALILEDAVRDLEPFEITLGELGTFSHKSSTTLWASCDSEDQALETLQAAIEREPWTEQSERGDHGFTPHLTLGSLKGSEVHADIAEARQIWEEQRFWCTEVALISRRDDGPFEIRRRVPLARGAVAALALRDELGDLDETKAVLNAMEIAEKVASAQEISLELIGSRSFEGMLPGADIDLLAVGEQSSMDILRDLHERLSSEGKVKRIILVEESKQPVLRALVGELWLDIQASSTSADDLGSKRAMECAEVARALTARAASIGAQEVFAQATRFLKLWAKRRGIDGAAWGFWPGIAWATVAAKACVEVASVTSLTRQPIEIIDAMASNALTLERVLKQAFTSLAGWGWSETYGIGAELARFDGPGDWMPVVAPGAPSLNLTRGMTTTTTEIMRREFARGAEIAWQAWLRQTSWRELLERSASKTGTPGLLISVSAETEDALEQAMGLLRGRVMKLLLELEQGAATRPRPWPAPRIAASSASWFIGLPGTNVTQHELALLAASEFIEALSEELSEESGEELNGTRFEVSLEEA